MNNIKRLLTKYKNYTPNPYKTIDEIIEYLKSKFDTRELALSEFTEIEMALFIKEVDSVLYKEKSRQGYDIAAIEVLKSEKSKSYYNNPFIFMGHAESRIYVLFEKNTDYIKCNSSELITEIIIWRGVREEDYKNKTIAYINYLATVERDSEN